MIEISPQNNKYGKNGRKRLPHNSDVIGLVNDADTVVNNYTYDAWGNILSETETVDNPIKYAGEYYDDELGMYYLRARYYDPSIGRFASYDIQEGDITNPLDMNRYVYCANNPIKYVDPSGEAVETVFDIISIGLSLNDLITNPSWVNFGFLVWDVASVILPAIPGSYIYDGAKVLDGVTGLSKLTKGNFRKNLTNLVGDAPSWMNKPQAHHVLPQQFEDWFKKVGLNIHDPRFGVWVDGDTHAKFSKSYNDYWKDYIDRFPNASQEQIVNYARTLSELFGYDVNY